MTTTAARKQVPLPIGQTISRICLYIILVLMAAFTLIPFVWMISSSLKLD